MVALLGILDAVVDALQLPVGAQAGGAAGLAAGPDPGQSHVVQPEFVVVAGQREASRYLPGGVDQVAVTVDVGRQYRHVVLPFRTQDGIDLVDVGVGQHQVAARLEAGEKAVVGLLVLPPGHAPDKALVIQQNALPADNALAILVLVAQPELVDFTAGGVQHR